MSSKPKRGSGKSQLLHASRKLFATAPLAEIGVAEILDEARVKAPTLYHHFGDKEGLFVAWAEEVLRDLKSKVRESAQSSSDPMKSLEALARTLAEVNDMDLLRTLDSSNRLVREESKRRIDQAFFESVFEPICLALMACQDAGRLSIDSLEKSATAFLYGVLAISDRSRIPTSGADADFHWQVSRFAFGFIRPLP